MLGLGRVFSSLFFAMVIILVALFDDFLFFLYGAVSVWCLGLFLLDSKNFVARFYWVIFGVFFILPVLVLGGQFYLEHGTILGSILLAPEDTVTLVKVIFLFLSTFLFTATLGGPVSEVPDFSRGIKRQSLFYCFLCLSFLVVVSFNLIEMDAIYSQGYVAFQKGELAVKKSLPVLLFEIFFMVLVSLGLYAKSRICFVALMVYALTSMFTGVRMPGATLAFFGVLYFYPHWRVRLVSSLLVMMVCAPPLLMLTQDLRVVGYSAFSQFDLGKGYYDLIKVLGFTVDTLKAAIIVESGDFNISPFFKPLQVLSVFLERVLGIEFSVPYTSFGPALTQYFEPELYERTGTTFGSSAIAEAWYYLGYLGVVLLGVGTFYISKFFSFLSYGSRVWGTLVYFIFLPRFIMSVRNELFGWFFEGAIFFALSIPFVLLVILLFGSGRIVRNNFGGEDVAPLNDKVQ